MNLLDNQILNKHLWHFVFIYSAFASRSDPYRCYMRFASFLQLIYSNLIFPFLYDVSTWSSLCMIDSIWQLLISVVFFVAEQISLVDNCSFLSPCFLFTLTSYVAVLFSLWYDKYDARAVYSNISDSDIQLVSVDGYKVPPTSGDYKFLDPSATVL